MRPRPTPWLAVVVLAALGAVGPRAVQAQTTVVEYYHLDALGSVRVVTDATGAVIRRHDYTPFGEEVTVTYPTPDRKLFTGQERDQQTGLDYFGARYYRAGIGRFTTADPVAGHLEDPQSLNAYAYARNNPLRYIDPTGLDFHLSCAERSGTCQSISGSNGALVQGTTGANGAFTPTVITSVSLTNPTSGNTAVVNAGGVLITTGGGTSAQKTSQGIFINGTPAADIAGDPKAAGWSSFTFHVSASDLEHGVFSKGTAVYSGKSDVAQALTAMGAFHYALDIFNRGHGDSSAFRFTSGAHPELFDYGPSLHVSVPKARIPTLTWDVDSRTGLAHYTCSQLGKGCF